MTPRLLFVTGTDTDAGKTTVTAALLRALLAQGTDASALKPVQTGCGLAASGQLAAPDAARYLEAAAPVAPDAAARVRALRLFRPACSPHLAASDANEALGADELARACWAAARGLTLVEGAGGVLAPLNARETMLDLMLRLDAPVLLVGANRLGCINHTLLALRALHWAGLRVAGLILCRTRADAPGRLSEDNAATLARMAPEAPLLAELPFLPGLDADPAAREAAWTALAQALRPVARRLCAATAIDGAGSEAETLAFDREHLWHPYDSALHPLPVREAAGASGVRLRLRDGRELVDGMSSWWCAIHGYRHPALVEAVQKQAARLSHVMFGGLTHRPAVELGRRLLALFPPGLTRLFLVDSGSVAVEVALKMAVQCQQARGRRDKTGIVALRGAYHGDTLGAMSVCDPITGMHRLFSGILPAQRFVERPSCRFGQPFDPDSLRPMETLLRREAKTLAAVIVEPVVQGAGGMWFYHPDYLRGVRRLCSELDILLIADEIATGFGRTGRLFASEWAGMTPDILCCGKALTGGMLTLAAVAATENVARAISGAAPADGGGLLMHGPTFMANPLACAAACASLDLLAASPWRARVEHIEQVLGESLAPCRALPDVTDVRVLGAIGVVEIGGWANVAALQDFFVSRGVWIRPFGHTIYLMPPYIIGDEDLRLLSGAVFAALAEGRQR